MKVRLGPSFLIALAVATVAVGASAALIEETLGSGTLPGTVLRRRNFE